jgi:hypothetical protein
MTNGAGRVADSTGNWVDGIAPAWLRPYLRLARLDRPIGSWLLLIPCWWSAALAAVHAGTPVNVWHVLLFFIGAFAMRGAGCTWNDIVDRDLDGLVERTRSRPIPSGQVTVGAGFNVMTDPHNDLLKRDIEVQLAQVQFDSQDNFRLSVARRYERLDTPFAITRHHARGRDGFGRLDAAEFSPLKLKRLRQSKPSFD